MLHYDVVTVCVNTDIAALLQSPVQAEGSSTFYISGGSDAVDNAVKQVLKDGYRTSDIMSEGCKKVGCREMGTLLAERI